MPWKKLNLGILAHVVPGKAPLTNRLRRARRQGRFSGQRAAAAERVLSRGPRGWLAPGRDVAATFLRWTFLRSVFHRGYVLVSGLYFVIDAHLAASQLLVLGTVLSVTLLVSDLPTGV